MAPDAEIVGDGDASPAGRLGVAKQVVNGRAS